MKVLLCDDSRVIRLVLGELLRQMGCTEIREAGCGHEAVQAVRKERFDLILLDISMPGQDGFTTLEMIKAPGFAQPDTPVVMVTSDADRRQMKRAWKLGAVDYVKKPFKADDLATMFLRLSVQNGFVVSLSGIQAAVGFCLQPKQPCTSR